MIFEPAHNGHHLQYVRILLEALVDLVDDLIVVLGVDALRSSEFAVHLSGVEFAGVRFCATIGSTRSAGAVGHTIGAIRALRESILQHRPERVYIPYGDGLIQALGVAQTAFPGFVPDVPIELLVMRGRFAYPSAEALRPLRSEALYHLSSLARIDVLHVLDPLVYAEIKARGGALARRAIVIPEAVEPLPAVSKLEARSRLRIDGSGRYIVCAGALDARKGVPELLRAVASAELPVDVKVLLVGRWNPELQPSWAFAKAALGERLLLIDRYVDEDEFACSILAADVVAVPYPEHQGSSGLLVRAAAAERYVLASAYGWIGWVTQTFGLGSTTDVLHAPSFQTALRAAMDAAPIHRLSAKAERLMEFHTAQNQRAHWRSRILALAGSRDDSKTEWSAVVRNSRTR